jgi:hypothetical protein
MLGKKQYRKKNNNRSTDELDALLLCLSNTKDYYGKNVVDYYNKIQDSNEEIQYIDFDYSEPTRYLTGNDGIRSEVKAKEWESKDGNYRVTYNPKIDQYVVNSTRVQNAHFDSLKEAIDNINTPREYDKLTPSAPFVTDTNAWTKLGLKYALRHAVEEGATKLAWTTGEQQNSRYDLSKHIDNLEVTKDAGGWKILGKKGGETVTTKFANTPAEIEAFIGKDMAEKITTADIPEGKTKTYSGVELQVGGKGMKGFYGSTKENSLGIVGNVAKSLFKQEPKTVKIPRNNE